VLQGSLPEGALLQGALLQGALLQGQVPEGEVLQGEEVPRCEVLRSGLRCWLQRLRPGGCPCGCSGCSPGPDPRG